MLVDINIKNILFLDIETVPCSINFEDLDDNFQQLWIEKTAWQRKDDISPSDFYTLKAGIMAEFAKIICISVGYLFVEKGENHFRIKSFYGDDEKQMFLCIYIWRYQEGGGGILWTPSKNFYFQTYFDIHI